MYSSGLEIKHQHHWHVSSDFVRQYNGTKLYDTEIR